jgi:hypothetical protein
MDGTTIGILVIITVITTGTRHSMLDGTDLSGILTMDILTIMVTHIMAITIFITVIYTTEEIMHITLAEEVRFTQRTTLVVFLIDALHRQTDVVQ